MRGHLGVHFVWITSPPEDATWRQRLAWWLRRKADRLDGLESNGVAIRTDANVPPEVRDDLRSLVVLAPLHMRDSIQAVLHLHLNDETRH